MQLTPTSYIVLGLVRYAGSATPYELKQAIPLTVGNFWSIPHSQLYAEPDRLADAGYLEREQEPAGRRRKSYRLTRAGGTALDGWLRGGGAGGVPELRDPALLKLFFGADPASIASEQVVLYEAKLAEWETMRAADPGGEPRGPWLALDAGIRHARESIRFWKALAAGE